MKIPVIQGVIDRRILINYQVDPECLERVLPPPLRPILVGDVGIAGICLIRLREIRPRWVPKALGIRSENAAHRIAVSLPDGSEGVFIPRRDTSSRLNSLAGGRLFPGVHHRSRFEVREQEGSYEVSLRHPREGLVLSIRAHLAEALSQASAFRSLAEVSSFFEAGSLGYSPASQHDRLDGLELRTKSWHVAPLAVDEVRSSFFDDTDRFPDGSVRFDSALLMRDIRHEWHARAPLYCGEQRREASRGPTAGQPGNPSRAGSSPSLTAAASAARK